MATLMLMPTDTTERGPLMPRLSPRLMLMPTTDTTAEDTDTEDIEDTSGDKFPSTSTKQKLKANITPCYLTLFILQCSSSEV